MSLNRLMPFFRPSQTLIANRDMQRKTTPTSSASVGLASNSQAMVAAIIGVENPSPDAAPPISATMNRKSIVLATGPWSLSFRNQWQLTLKRRTSSFFE